MTATPKKTTRRKSGRTVKAKARSSVVSWRENRVLFATLGLTVVAIALAALLTGLFLRDSSIASSRASSASVPASPPAPVAPPAVAAPPAPSVEPIEAQSALPPPLVRPVPTTPPPRQTASYKLPLRPIPPPAKAKYLIFIVDDAGYSLKQLEAFLELPFPITISVLPDLPDSEKAAQAVRAAGKELILHQPMQALGGQNPGPGAILLGMGRDEIEGIIEANLKTVPGAIGMNNHMGSAATTDLGIMEAVTAVAKRRGIYYVDSLTTSGTAVAEAARREGIPYWERNVFLDNAPDRASIIRAVEDGKKLASKDRPAIMIGHVWSAELAQTLTDLYPQLVAEGFSLSTISRFMVQEAEEDDASPGN